MEEELEIWSVRNVAADDYTYYKDNHPACPNYYRIPSQSSPSSNVEIKSHNNGHWVKSGRYGSVKSFELQYKQSPNIVEITNLIIIKMISDDRLV